MAAEETTVQQYLEWSPGQWDQNDPSALPSTWIAGWTTVTFTNVGNGERLFRKGNEGKEISLGVFWMSVFGALQRGLRQQEDFQWKGLNWKYGLWSHRHVQVWKLKTRGRLIIQGAWWCVQVKQEGRVSNWQPKEGRVSRRKWSTGSDTWRLMESCRTETRKKWAGEWIGRNRKSG